MREKQFALGGHATEFAKYWKLSARKVHGGEHAKGKRKTARPFSSKKPIHVVMRSEKATAGNSFRNFRHYGKVAKLIQASADRHQIKLYKVAINSNHFHLLAHSKTKRKFQNFLRLLAGQIAQLITAAVKGRAFGRFWTGLSFTRIAEWGKDFRGSREYVLQNELEATRSIPYRARRSVAKQGPLLRSISSTLSKPLSKIRSLSAS